ERHGWREYSGMTNKISVSLHASRKAQLPPCFVHRDRHGIRKIEAAVVGLHRQSQTLRFWNGCNNLCGQATGFASEQQRVAIGETGVGVAVRRVAGECKDARPLQARETR